MPERAAAARDAIAAPVRLSTLHFLLRAPGSTRTQIAAGTDNDVSSVRAALVELEQLGFVTADVAEPRNGRTVRYSASRGAVTDDLVSFVAWMLR